MKKIILVLTSLFGVVFCLGVASYSKLGVYNPFMSMYGVTQIKLFDKDFVKLQNNPEVYIAQPNSKDDDSLKTLINYIEKQGYEYLENQRMGSLLVFKKVDKDYIMHVNFQTNKHYTLWTNFTKLIE